MTARKAAKPKGDSMLSSLGIRPFIPFILIGCVILVLFLFFILTSNELNDDMSDAEWEAEPLPQKETSLPGDPNDDEQAVSQWYMPFTFNKDGTISNVNWSSIIGMLGIFIIFKKFFKKRIW